MNETISSILDTSTPAKLCGATVAAASIGYLTLKGLQYVFSTKSSAHLYPPGPPRQFLLGALKSFPKDHFYQRFCEWSNAYGDIVYAPVPGLSMVILNSYDVAQELLTKRPNSTGGRKGGYLVLTLMGWHWSVLFLQSSHPSHVNQRKMLRKAMGPQRVGSHDITIESTVAKLMLELETLQGNPNHTIQRVLGRMVIELTYGEKLWNEIGQDLIGWNMKALEHANEAFSTFWFVDIFHFLRFIPEWVGLRFKVLARESTDLTNKLRFEAYKRCLESYKSGTLGHCVLSDMLDEFGDDGDVRDAAAALYANAAETTTGALISCLHSVLLYPEVSQRMFEEIQSVTHGHRLPTISDRANLPYCIAVFKETIRKRPFMPLGIPHANDQDEVIKGYIIPKGTMIHYNTGSMLSDPKVWKDPDVFRPERFLEPDAGERPDPLTLLFGYGRRVCPGRYLADRLAFQLLVTINSLFKLVPLESKPIPDPSTVEWSDIVVQQPIGFECRFIPRDEKARNLLKAISLNE
ncbi:cytochrome P450 [Serendipita vermifera]|nr:cytochrome P450 [Serendipita vermifera]